MAKQFIFNGNLLEGENRVITEAAATAETLAADASPIVEAAVEEGVANFNFSIPRGS